MAYWSRPSFDFCYRVAVVSPEDPNPPAIPANWGVVEAPNRMQTKWQAGLDAMKGKVDAVMMMGSDDLATPGLVQAVYDKALEHGMAYPFSMHTFNEETQELVYAKYGTVYAGCAYSMEVVEKAGGRIFVSERSDIYAPDVVSAGKCRPHANPYRLPLSHEMGEAVVDIKSSQNVWPFSYVAHKIKRKHRELPCPPPAEFFGTHFPGFVYSP